MWTPAYPDRHRLFPSTWVGSAAFTAIQQETAEWGKKWLATKISLTRKPARIPFVPSPVLFSGGNLNRYSAGRARAKWPLGSGPRYMICVTLFCTLRESENTRTCENCTRNTRACENCTRNTRACENCTRNASDSRISVCFLTRTLRKNVRQNLTPRATA